MQFHHVGCAVRDARELVGLYRKELGFGRVTRSFEIPSQKVRVRFIEIGPSSYLEVVAPIGSPSPIDQYLATGYYHVCFLTDDLSAALGNLGLQFVVLTEFESAAFDSHRCAFVVSPQRHLIELAEMSRGDFRAFFERSLAG